MQNLSIVQGGDGRSRICRLSRGAMGGPEFVDCPGTKGLSRNILNRSNPETPASVARFLNSKNSHWTRLPKPGVQIPGCGNTAGLSGLVEQAQRNSFLSEIGLVWISGFGSPASIPWEQLLASGSKSNLELLVWEPAHAVQPSATAVLHATAIQ